LDIGKVTQKRVKLTLKRQDFGIIELEACESRDVANFVDRDGHLIEFITGEGELKG